jgi:hypothetical protein
MKTKHYLFAMTITGLFAFYACKKNDSNDDSTTSSTSSTSTTSATDAKERAREDFNTMYKATAVTGFSWNGNVNDCNPGTLSKDVLDKALIRVKYFRKVAGLPNDNIRMVASLNTKCQWDALMTKANNALSHSPLSTWKCYSEDGAEAARNGNIAMGASDVANMRLWMQDEGANNTKVGHRRWILYSRAGDFGFGCTNTSGTLWVINSGVGSSPLPAKTPSYIAWPPKGFVPRDVVYPRWSLSVPAPTYPYQVDFTNATVVMTNAKGDNIPLVIEYANPIENTYMGDNTLVWKPSGIDLLSDADQKYTVKVSNVKVGGEAKDYQYDVTIFKP